MRLKKLCEKFVLSNSILLISMKKKFETYKNMYHSQDTSESRYGQENNLFDFNNYYDLFMKSCDL